MFDVTINPILVNNDHAFCKDCKSPILRNAPAVHIATPSNIGIYCNECFMATKHEFVNALYDIEKFFVSQRVMNNGTKQRSWLPKDYDRSNDGNR